MKMLVGVLVGGNATRLGGVAKGMLPAPDTGEALAARLCRICREATDDANIVLLGQSAAYSPLGIPALADDPKDVGPLGALAALLSEAETRGCDAVAIATDLPFVTTSMVVELVTHAPGAAAVAPRPSGIWQPLFARYAPAPCLPIARALLGARRFAARGILEELGARALTLSLGDDEERLLHDWDTPEDVNGRR